MIPFTDPKYISAKGDGSRNEIDVNKPNTSDDASIAKDKRNLKSCGLLYPELMKTRSATIELQDKQEDLDEVVEDFEGKANCLSNVYVFDNSKAILNFPPTGVLSTR